MRRAVIVMLMMALSVMISPTNDVSAAEATFDRCQECGWTVTSGIGGWYTQSTYYENTDGQCGSEAEYCIRCNEGGGENINTDGCDGAESELNGPYSSQPDAREAITEHCSSCEMNELLALAATYIENGAVSDLAQLVESSDGIVTVNSDRRAVQGVGCGGKVALHVPVGGDFLKALESDIRGLNGQ